MIKIRANYSGKLKYIYNEINYFNLVMFLSLVSLQLHSQPPIHDPCNVMKDGDRYWVFYTANGIGAHSASDPEFIDWQSEPSVFGSTWPSWINDYVPAFSGQFWAPACIYMNNKYYLYYSCSTMGSHISAIGLVTSPSLNNPEWTDQGMIVYSDGSNTATTSNAIDPAIFRDDDGRVWMTYGSWFGGITIIEIDSVTGKIIGGKTQLAGGNHLDIEASYLMSHAGYYYLFVNRANCCRGVNSTYYIQVGRSTSVTGPYSEWRTFLETDGRFIGPGHFGYGEKRLTYHFYDRDDDGVAKLINTTLAWIDGWPVAGEVLLEIDSANIINGTYRIYSSDSSKIIGVSNNSPAQGANVQISNYTDPGISGQSWTLSNTCFNNYKVSPDNYSNLGLDVYNCTSADSTNIGLWSYWAGTCQQWRFIKLSDGSYQIKSALFNKCLEIEGMPITDGANIFQYRCDTSNQNQLFWLELLEFENTTKADSFPAVISYTSEQCGNPASNIIDGNPADNSRWSTRGFPKTAVIDYGETKSITGIRIYTYQSRAYQYTVELDDNIDFASPFVINRISNTTTSQPISDYFEAVAARYARLTVLGASVSTIEWVSITEFEIYDGPVNYEVIEATNISLAIYPNPVVDVLNISLSEKLKSNSKLIIYNTVGQTVFSKNNIIERTASFNISALESGIYNLILSNDQLTVSKRFVKH